MPVRNAGPYLAECLDSIITQTETLWELWTVDDHSDDNSAEILRAYAIRDTRMHTLVNKGRGIIDALRTAYSQSTGNYITRMDADDVMMPEKLAILLSHTYTGAIATGGVEYFRDDVPLGDGYTRYADWLNALCADNSHWSAIYKECVIPSPAWMMDRETFERVGAFSSKVYPEDYDLAFRCYATGLEVSASTDIIHRWRDHGERASRNDPHYTDNSFLNLKLQHFLRSDYDGEGTLCLVGAGKKGKYCARYLIDAGIEFDWFTDNPRKLTVPIYGVTLQAESEIPEGRQCIIAVAGPEDVAALEVLLEEKCVEGYWFC